eukprot:9453514-Ditylum_brightwellii.AAC.1
MYAGFVSHWTEPGHLTYKYFLRAYEVGMQTGNIDWAMFSLRTSNNTALMIGKPLACIEKECKSCIELMHEYKQKMTTNLLRPVWQFVLNLMGESDDPKVLSGSVMQQEELMKNCNQNEFRALRNVTLFYRLWAAFCFEDFDLA